MDFSRDRKAYNAIVESGNQTLKKLEEKIERYKKQVEQANKLIDDAAAAQDREAYLAACNERDFALAQIRKQENLIASGVIPHGQLVALVDKISKERDEAVNDLLKSIDGHIKNLLDAMDKLMQVDAESRQLMQELVCTAKQRSGEDITLNAREEMVVIPIDGFTEIKNRMRLIYFWKDRFEK